MGMPRKIGDAAEAAAGVAQGEGKVVTSTDEAETTITASAASAPPVAAAATATATAATVVAASPSHEDLRLKQKLAERDDELKATAEENVALKKEIATLRRRLAPGGGDEDGKSMGHGQEEIKEGGDGGAAIKDEAPSTMRPKSE